MSTHIDYVDARIAPEPILRAMHRLHLTWDEEMLPGDPPVPIEQRIIDWRNPYATESVRQWAMWEGSEVVAISGVSMDLAQNLENAVGWVYVHPEARGRDLGREIAAPMLDVAEADGRIRIAFGVIEGRPEEALAARAGLRAAYREQLNRLPFQEIDWSLMERWLERAAERASEYELLFLPSPIPDEHLDAFCDLALVMNTAPREDFEEEDEVLTPEMWRDIEAKEARRAFDILTYVARHQPTGAFAGFTTAVYHRLRPDLVWQMETAVDPAHRDRGLGRWVKAAMALKLRSEYPSVKRVETFNAGSNAPMLSINVEMGFKPVFTQTMWQGDLAVLRENLSV